MVSSSGGGPDRRGLAQLAAARWWTSWERQRLLLAAHIGLSHLPELQDVVTAVVGLPGAAPECRQSAGQHGGQIASGGLPRHPHAVPGPAGELHGDIELGRLQDVDRERDSRQVTDRLGRPGQ